jgi:periplasmic copper chaperone A
MNIRSAVHTVGVVLTSAVLLAGCGQPAAPVLDVVEPFTPQPAARDIATVYLTIRNTGETDDALIAASTDITERVELHQSIVENGLVTMRHVEELVVPAGGQLVLEPGGHHLMLINPEPLAEGDTYTLRLTFRESDDLDVEVPVTAITGEMGMAGSGSEPALNVLALSWWQRTAS